MRHMSPFGLICISALIATIGCGGNDNSTDRGSSTVPMMTPAEMQAEADVDLPTDY